MSQQPQQTVMPSNMLPPGEAELAQANSYYPQEPADLTGGLPINLDSLRDGPPGSKPFYPYSTLIRYASSIWTPVCPHFASFPTYRNSRYAIKGSPNQKLLLEDIYYAIESRVRIFLSPKFALVLTPSRPVPIF